MTKEQYEQVKKCFEAIECIAAGFPYNRYRDHCGVRAGVEMSVRHIRNKLDKVEELLKEPEPKSGTVVRLTDLCNRLEAENHKLKRQVEQFRAGWYPWSCTPNGQLKERNAQLEQNLITVELQLAQVHNQLKRAQQYLEGTLE